MAEFVESAHPRDVLSENDQLEFDARSQIYKRHEATTAETVKCCHDLTVLAQADFKMLLKWRKTMKASRDELLAGAGGADAAAVTASAARTTASGLQGIGGAGEHNERDKDDDDDDADWDARVEQEPCLQRGFRQQDQATSATPGATKPPPAAATQVSSLRLRRQTLLLLLRSLAVPL